MGASKSRRKKRSSKLSGSENMGQVMNRLLSGCKLIGYNSFEVFRRWVQGCKSFWRRELLVEE